MPQLYLTGVGGGKGTFLIENKWYIITKNTGEIGPITPALVVDILNEKAALQNKTQLSTVTNEKQTQTDKESAKEIATQTELKDVTSNTSNEKQTQIKSTQTDKERTTETATQTEFEDQTFFDKNKYYRIEKKDLDDLVSKFETLLAENEKLLAENEKLQAKKKDLQNQNNKEDNNDSILDTLQRVLRFKNGADQNDGNVSNRSNKREPETLLDYDWKKKILNELTKRQKDVLKKIEKNEKLEDFENPLTWKIIEIIKTKYYVGGIKKTGDKGKDYLKTILNNLGLKNKP